MTRCKTRIGWMIAPSFGIGKQTRPCAKNRDRSLSKKVPSAVVCHLYSPRQNHRPFINLPIYNY